MALNKLGRLALLLTLCLCVSLPALAVEALPLNLEELVLFLDGRDFALDTPAKPLVDAMKKGGQPVDILEADSCLFSGKDKEFSTQELLVGALPRGDKGADVIETLMVLSGDHLTRRGIGLGSKGEDILTAYGEPTLRDYDLIIYTIDGAMDSPQLVFVMDLATDTVQSYYYFLNTQG